MPTADPETAASSRGRRRRRLALLAISLAGALVIAVVIAWQRGRAAAPVTSAGSGSGRAAIQAPAGPSLPGARDGVRLTGHIIDGTGAPIANAEVSAELEKGVVDRALSTTPRTGTGSGSAGSGSAGSGSSTANAGSGSAAAPAIVVAPLTGVDGRFELAGLASGRYRLRVTGQGLVPAEVRYIPAPSDEIRIVISRQVRIDGTVTHDGAPVPNATVGLRSEIIGGEVETRTDARGAFQFPSLPEGRYQIYAWQGALAARALRISRLGAGPFEPVALALEPAAIVTGRVIDRDSGAGLAAAIELRPSGDDQAPRFARSGDDGAFRIEGVPNGRWIADAFAPGYTSPGGVEFDAGRGVPELALVRGATLEGRVLDGEGRPIAGATVRALTGEGEAAQEASAAVDQDRLRRYSGRMAAPAPIAGALPTDDPTFLARGELGVMVGPIPPLPAPGAQIARAASIDPSIGVLAGEPAPLLSDPERQSIWTTGPDGRYRIRGLPKGKTAALAVAVGFAEGRSRSVVLDAGQTVSGVDIVLSPGTFVVGRVTNQHQRPVAGAQITARPELGAELHAFSDADGSYRLGPVSGSIELSASAYGHAEVTRAISLAVATGREAAERREDFMLGVADAELAGILEDATGAVVAGAQLEVISGVAGGRYAVVAADGTFAIEALPAGPVRVRVRHPAYPLAELDATATAGSRVTVRLKLALGGAAEGVVLDERSGAPVSGATLSGAGPRGSDAEATTDPSGRWKLGPLAPGSWKLVVKAPGFLAFSRELDVPVARTPGVTSVRDVRLELQRGALVGGTVRDARGNRAANAKIAVHAADGSGPVATGATDAQGEFRIADAPTGDVVVTATRDDGEGAVRATVRPGDQILSLSIELR